MYFLFSGEGATDLGACADGAPTCERDDYRYGPMTVIVAQIVEARHRYSLLDAGCCGFVSEGTLVDRASELKAAKKAMRLPGKKREKETRYFFNNARVLARIAREREGERKDDVVAVLFRDADRATAGRGSWRGKRQSMEDGFTEEGLARGVPMIPKPTSEAWVIAGMTGGLNHRGKPLEDWSGKTGVANSLKAELEGLMGEKPSPEKLCEMVRERSIDYEKITLPTFIAFKKRLEAVL